MPRPEQIQQAIRNVTDQRSFIDGLLHQTLNWPIDLDFENIGDISYEWTDDELNAAGLSRSILTGPVLQMQSLIQNQPWGIFILEFTNPDALITGRGLTGPLRKVLRGLVPKRRGGRSNLPNWERENLLFICTHNYQHFRFAYFKPAKQKGQAEPLAIFGWDSGDAALRTLCEYNLPFLVWSDNLQQPQWRDAFNVEKVTKGFYSQVAKLFTDLVGGSRKQGSKTYQGKNLLILPGSQSDTIRKEFAVRLIGRLVFCWFLKKKKSKDDVPLLPQELLSTESMNNKGIGGYYHSILEPLFFEVLNTPEDERNKQFKKAPWSIIPFLNGGLFTPHEDDFYKLTFNGISEHLNDLIVPDDLIRELFEVFETYNFTIEESTPLDIEVAVDPEILGRIFENLLAEINPQTGETARKATGSYYTPRPIVEYMVDESLKQYLITKTNLPEEKISLLLSYSEEDTVLTESEKDAVLDALDTIKIIDPACGSGAFPMGILQKILLMLQKIDPDSRKWLSRILAKVENNIARKELERDLKSETINYIHKLGIIQNSIFGVDIQPIAVEISKLRCFLSLIVDENVGDKEPNRVVKPLPNLEFKFVCANTLIGLPKQDKQQTMFEDKDSISELKRLRDEYLGSYGKEKKLIEERFRKVQSKMFEHSLNWQGKETQTLKLSQWDPFSHESCPWFDPEWMFGIKEGFDIAIANPPYVRVQNLTHKEIDMYKSIWETAWKRIDICTIFFESASKLLSHNGVGCFISSNQFLNVEYGRKIREFFLQKAGFFEIVDFSDLPVFGNQLTYVSIFLFKPTKLEKIYYSQVSFLPFDPLNLKFFEIITNKLNGETWNLCNPTFKNLVNKLSTAFESLSSIASTWAGIITGKDSILLFDENDPQIGNFERELLMPVLRAEGCGRYRMARPTKIVIYPYKSANVKTVLLSETELKKYRNVFSYLLKNKEALLARRDSRRTMEERGNWYGLVRFGQKEVFSQPKIVTPGEVKRNSFGIDYSQSAFSCARVFAITLNDSTLALKYLLAILNSSLIEFYLHHSAPVKAGGYFSYSSTVLDSIPIANCRNQKLYINLVDQVLTITRSDDYQNNKSKQAEVKKLESQIDQMVYKLYGLTKEEIEIVEGHSKAN